MLAVVGPVGAGKVRPLSVINNNYYFVQSTLLQCLLKELTTLSGTVSIRGSVAYSSQEPCIFSTNLRENILFGLPYDEEWYKTVVHACALEKVKI